MNTRSAAGFFLLGVLMWLLPNFAPELFPKNGIDGSSARAMWTTVMALVHVTLGLVFLLQYSVVPEVMRWLADEPPADPVWQQEPVPVRFANEGNVTLRARYADVWRALKVAFVDEKRFMEFLERFRLLAETHRQGTPAPGRTPVVFGHDAEHALVDLMQSRGINLRLLERRSRDWLGKVTAGSFLRQAADEITDVMSDTRRAA